MNVRTARKMLPIFPKWEASFNISFKALVPSVRERLHLIKLIKVLFLDHFYTKKVKTSLFCLIFSPVQFNLDFFYCKGVKLEVIIGFGIMVVQPRRWDLRQSTFFTYINIPLDNKQGEEY